MPLTNPEKCHRYGQKLIEHIRQNYIKRKRKKRAEMKMSEAAYWHYKAPDALRKNLPDVK